MKENILSNRSLFRPLQLGSYTLKNRIVLPPLTRQRSTQPGNAANELMATYYQQRAGAGLLISEGTYATGASSPKRASGAAGKSSNGK